METFRSWTWTLGSLTVANINTTTHLDESQLPQKISWIPVKSLDPEIVEPGGLINKDGRHEYLYVARATYLDGIIPGQWNPKSGLMLFGNGEREEISISPDKASILHLPKGSTSWVKHNKHQVNYNLIVGGNLPGAKTLLYICRAIQTGHNLVIGYRLQQGGNCIVTYNGDQHELEDYELLSATDYGMISGSVN